VKLTVQIKLQPDSLQADALKRTLEVANRACDWLSEQAWTAKEFRQFPLHRLGYKSIREQFALSAQVVVRLIAKVADAYKPDKKRQRKFRSLGSISFDDRILAYNLAKSEVSIWTVDGRQTIRFVCGDRQRELLAFRRGESDLVTRDGFWFLFATVDVPDIKEREVQDFIGVDLGIVAIAHTSDETRFAGGQLNGLRARHRRIRKRLQSLGTRSAKRLLRKRRGREGRFATHVNHSISKQLVSVAERTGRGIALEKLSGIRNRIRARKSERTRLHSWAFGQLQSFVLYKAKRAGVPVVFVDPRNTSRKCAVCDTVSKANRKTQAAFECIACGHTNNADANAAENIRRAAVNLPNATSVVSATRMSHLVVSGSELDWKS